MFQFCKHRGSKATFYIKQDKPKRNIKTKTTELWPFHAFFFQGDVVHWSDFSSSKAGRKCIDECPSFKDIQGLSGNNPTQRKYTAPSVLE